MTIPSLITELSTTASSNPPAGSETSAEGDNHIRQAYAFIAQNYDLKATKASPTFTGAPAAPTAAVDTNTTQLATTAFVIGQAYAKLASPTFTGTVNAAAITASGTMATQADADGVLEWRSASAAVRGSIKNVFANSITQMNGVGGIEMTTAGVARLDIDASGNTISTLTASAPTLGVNSQLVFNLTSNTNLRISVRGTDGATRTANITLA